jgi:hypothetical protein
MEAIIMTQNLAYQQSIAAEFNAIKNRVRYFIGDRHWGEEGHYKEVILMNFLRKILPSTVKVGTGFVKNERNDLTSQIDIIIYKRDSPVLFKEGDFVITMPESIIGIIEVKSKTSLSLLAKETCGRMSPIKKSQTNGDVIGKDRIFNGIFSYDFSGNISGTRNSCFEEQIKHVNNLNCICFNEDYFCLYWGDGNPRDRDKEQDSTPCFSFYNLSSIKVTGNNGNGFAFGYFISNLLETVYRFTNESALNRQYFEHLYPIEGGKENYRIPGIDIKIR